MPLTVKNFFRFYIFHPLHPELKEKKDRRIALTATIALGIFAGLAHLFVRLFIYDKQFLSKAVTQSKTPDVSEEDSYDGTTETETPYPWPPTPLKEGTPLRYTVE